MLLLLGFIAAHALFHQYWYGINAYLRLQTEKTNSLSFMSRFSYLLKAERTQLAWQMLGIMTKPQSKGLLVTMIMMRTKRTKHDQQQQKSMA